MGNPDSNIKHLIDSAVCTVDPTDYNKIEFLIKYDWDDTQRLSQDSFSNYPFPCKLFVYERGEGRHHTHHTCEYLFANRNPSFKWVMNMSDDFHFTRKDWLKDIESIKDEYMIVGYTRPTFEINSVCDVYRKCFPVNFDMDNGIGNYCPLMTTKLIEVAQNFGWQPNPDAWMVLLQMTLYRKYGFLLWKQIPQFYQRNGGYGSGDTPTRPNTDIYNNMTISGSRLPRNHYLFNLIDQQARNIYLNIMYPEEFAPHHASKLMELHDVTPVIDPEQQRPPEGYVNLDYSRQSEWLSRG